jgi:5'(3')-deoxyribonucleotidase
MHPHQHLIGLDVDGVVADLVQSLLDQVHQQTGQRFHPNQVQSFDLQQTLGDLWHVGQTILSQPGFASRIAPYPDALQGVDQLRKLGRVVFVTTPYEKSPTWSHDRTRWLERHTGAHPRDVVHLVDKTVFAGQLLIDDAPSQLEGWVATGRPAIRVVRPWNDGAPGRPAERWDEIVSAARELLPDV